MYVQGTSHAVADAARFIAKNARAGEARRRGQGPRQPGMAHAVGQQAQDPPLDDDSQWHPHLQEVQQQQPRPDHPSPADAAAPSAQAASGGRTALSV